MKRACAVLVIARLALAAGVLVGAAAAPAWADAYDATLTRAIAAKERALDVNEPARWEEALRLFQEADGLRATRETKYELGYAAERLNRHDLAVESYEAAMDLGLTGTPRAKAEAFVGAHASSMARLQIRGRPGNRIRVAGTDRGRLPLTRPLVLFPDETLLETVAPDGRRAFYTVHVSSGHLDVIDLAGFRPMPAPAPPPPPPPRAAPPAPAPWRLDAPPPLIVMPPLPAPPQPQEPPPPVHPADGAGSRPLATWLIAGGVTLGVASGVALLWSGDRLATLRGDLQANCDVPTGSDACAVAKAGARDQAQSDVNGIATWKGIRLASWIGAGAGLVTAGAGIAVLLSGSHGEGMALDSPLRTRRWSLAIAAGGGATGFSWTGVF